MTYIIDSLYNVRKVNNSKVNLPNGNCSFVTHIGDHSLRNNMILRDVLYVPEFKYNLLSISKISNDLNCAALFYPKFVVFENLSIVNPI